MTEATSTELNNFKSLPVFELGRDFFCLTRGRVPVIITNCRNNHSGSPPKKLFGREILAAQAAAKDRKEVLLECQ